MKSQYLAEGDILADLGQVNKVLMIVDGDNVGVILKSGVLSDKSLGRN